MATASAVDDDEPCPRSGSHLYSLEERLFGDQQVGGPQHQRPLDDHRIALGKHEQMEIGGPVTGTSASLRHAPFRKERTHSRSATPGPGSQQLPGARVELRMARRKM